MRMNKKTFSFLLFILNGLFAFASPNYLNVYTRIAQPNGTALENSSVQFRFTVVDPVGTCVIYIEDFSNINMAATKGLVSFGLGTGTKTYPAGPFTINQVFSNFASPVFNCQSGGTYTAASTDQRKLIMQFNDGSGWQSVPPMTVNSVPWAMEAYTAQKLGAFNASDYLRTAQLTACNPGEAVHFNGTAFTCLSSMAGSLSNGGNALGAAMTIGTNDANELNFETAGIPRVTIDATGNMGVGVTNPNAVFETNATGAKTATYIGNSISNTATSATNAISKTGLDVQSTGVWNGVSAVNVGLNVNVSGGTTNYAALFNGGNVGIGTTAPMHPLHVAGTTAQIGDGFFEMDSSDNDLSVGISNDIGASNGSVVFGRSNNSRYDNSVTFGTLNTINTAGAFNSMAIGHTNTVTVGGAIAIGKNVTNSVTNSLMIGPNDAAKVTILSTGNVGVGTTTPAAKLDVTGDVKIGNSSATCDATTKGSIRYNDASSVLEFCNGTSWNLVQAAACSDATPAAFAFNNESNATISTQVESNIIQISGINCSVPVTISGAGSPQFRICSDATCTSVVQGWTTSPSTILNNQYLQTRLTTDAVGGATFQATIIIGVGATVWSVANAGGDCVGTTPSVGTVCADGTIYAGLSPDGNIKMFTTRCDAGMTWDGMNCTGSRVTISFNNGTSNWILKGYTSSVTGKSNSFNLNGSVDIGAPYLAAQYCEALSSDGNTDWYLPAVNEIVVLHSGRHAIRNFDLSGVYYNSSTENTSTDSCVTRMLDGSIRCDQGKNANFYVRCVRR